MSEVEKKTSEDIEVKNNTEILEDAAADAVEDAENQPAAVEAEESIGINLFLDAVPEIIQIPYKSTIAELKAEVRKKIKVDFDEHRWVIGRLMPEDDSVTLEALQVSPVPVSISLFPLGNPKPVEADKDQVVAVNQNQFTEADNPPDNLLVIFKEEDECSEVGEAAALPEITEPKKSDLEYEELKKLEEYEAVPNFHCFECPICYEFYDPFQGIILRDCLHIFCRECIENNVKFNDNFEIKCPFADANFFCNSTLQEREIKAILGMKLYEKHLEKSLQHAALTMPESVNCRTADCDYWCLRDSELYNFFCPKCKKTNCLTCEVIHEGRTCVEYQDDLKLNSDDAKRRTEEQIDSMIKSQEAMPCPKCGIILTKISGCDSMDCSVCKTAICWATRGPRWGPKGKGDTSGGCRCKNPNICHPSCRNCH